MKEINKSLLLPFLPGKTTKEVLTTTTVMVLSTLHSFPAHKLHRNVSLSASLTAVAFPSRLKTKKGTSIKKLSIPKPLQRSGAKDR